MDDRWGKTIVNPYRTDADSHASCQIGAGKQAGS
jgi:hypothetical protein